MLDRTKLSPLGEGLLEASRIIELRGWCQGQGVDREGRVCALQAIFISFGDHNETNYLKAKFALAKHLGLDTECNLIIAGWNDHPGRSQDEVVNALRETAYKAD